MKLLNRKMPRRTQRMTKKHPKMEVSTFPIYLLSIGKLPIIFFVLIFIFQKFISIDLDQHLLLTVHMKMICKLHFVLTIIQVKIQWLKRKKDRKMKKLHSRNWNFNWKINKRAQNRQIKRIMTLKHKSHRRH